jgi:SP family sugar porter-like MFS transporter
MENSKSYLMLITFVAAMGGLLFGYDWVVIGGAKPFYELYFGIAENPVMQGVMVSCATLGCLLGVMVSGSIADRYGRKPLLMVAAIIFILAAVGTGMADSTGWFIFWRILGGTGIGIASNLSPMYIAEVSPAAIRGRFVSVQQLAIVIGILLAQICNWLIADPVVASEDILVSWNGQEGWRWMFWAGGIPAIAFFILVFIIPESPKWLAAQKKFETAQKVFTRIGGSNYAQNEINLLKNTPETEEKSDFRLLFRGRMPKILLCGIVLAVLQQWCGINVIFNYAQEVFSAAGYAVSDVLFNIVVTGVTNVIFTFVGMYTVDRIGRKALMLIGAAGLACIYAALGWCYYTQITGLAALCCVVAAIACYAMTFGPVVWIVIAEIFPTRVRGLAVAVSTFFLWSACFVLTYTFPLLNSELGASGTFWLYGLICFAGFLFTIKYLPETKGKTLEEIEKEFTASNNGI